MSANIRPGDVVTVGADRTPCRVLTFRLRPGGAGGLVMVKVAPLGGGMTMKTPLERLQRAELSTRAEVAAASEAVIAELAAKVARVEDVAKDMERAGDTECAELLWGALAGDGASDG